MSFSLTRTPVFLLLAVLGLATSTKGTSIALGSSHSCALLTGGAIKCWGWNEYGQLGDGTTNNNAIPVDVSGISTATSVALGYMHSCALLTGGVPCHLPQRPPHLDQLTTSILWPSDPLGLWVVILHGVGISSGSLRY